MIGEIFTKMNEFAKKRQNLPMTGGTALKTIFKLRDGYELTEEEAAHFDIDGQLVIENAEKEKIGKISTGHHKMKISAIYNIQNFNFVE